MMHTSFWWVSPPDISFVLQFFKFAHISLEGFIPSLHFSSLNWGEIGDVFFRNSPALPWCISLDRGALSRLPQPPQSSSWPTRADQHCCWHLQHIHRAHVHISYLLSEVFGFISGFCHISSSTEHSSLSPPEPRATFAEMQWNKGDVLSQWLLPPPSLSIPGSTVTFCGTFLSWGWLGEQAEVRRAQRAADPCIPH